MFNVNYLCYIGRLLIQIHGLSQLHNILEFYPYTKKWNSSHFNRTHFRTNAALKDNTTPGWFVSANGIKSLAINGCTFKNTRGENEVNFTGRGNGIHGWNSGLFIDSYCLQPQNEGCARSEPCVFQKLTRGVYSLNSAGAASVRLNGARFIDNKFGAYFSAFDNIAQVEVFSNTFELGTNVPEKGYGLYLDNCTGFHIEDNEFYRVQSSDIKGIGLVVNNSGTAPNEIYRNRFHNLKNATISQNVNRSYNPPLDLGGLCYKCNTFVKEDGTEPNLVDFAITYKDIPYGPTVGIAKNQGTYLSATDFLPAGNLFQTNPASTHFDFYNDGNAVIYYYHLFPPQNYRTKPELNNVGGLLSLNAVGIQFYSNYCPSTLGSNNTVQDLAGFLDASTQSDSYKTILNNQVDGGSTQDLNMDVMSATPVTTAQIHNELLGESPYLSDTVMKTSIIKEDVLDYAMIRDVLVANPQSAKSDEVLSLLETRVYPMPEYMMNQILSGVDTVSALEKLESYKAYWDGEIGKSYTRLLQHYQGDSTTQPNEDRLNWLFDYNSSLATNYDKAIWQHSQGHYSLTDSVLYYIPTSFTMTPEQTSIYSTYIDYLSLAAQIKSGTSNILTIDSLNEMSLNVLVSNEIGLPSVYARNLLITKGKSNYKEQVILIDPILKNSKRIRYKGVTERETYDGISVYPNPAHNYFFLKTNFSEMCGEGIIHIVNQHGMVVYSTKFRAINDQIFIKSELKSGQYLIVAFDSKKRLGTSVLLVH